MVLDDPDAASRVSPLTGILWREPLEHYCQYGVPGYYAGFEYEARRRAAFVGHDYQRYVEFAIQRDRGGRAPETVRSLYHRYETLLVLFLDAICAVGLLIGVGAIVFGRRES